MESLRKKGKTADFFEPVRTKRGIADANSSGGVVGLDPNQWFCHLESEHTRVAWKGPRPVLIKGTSEDIDRHQPFAYQYPLVGHLSHKHQAMGALAHPCHHDHTEQYNKNKRFHMC